MSIPKRRPKATRAQKRPDYTDPNTVISPKAYWRLTRVVCDGEADGWSAAEGRWSDKPYQKGRPRFALRWNGGPKSGSPIGTPQSRGHPTWFIIPEEIENQVRLAVARAVAEAAATRGGYAKPLSERLLELGRVLAEIPDRDTRTADEIVGYDERGLPR